MMAALPSCHSVFSPRYMPEDERRIAALEAQIDAVPRGDSISAYEKGSYEFFVSHRHYLDTMVVYRDRELLSRATSDCPIHICLQHQRGRLYVGGRVALDWPVSTGTPQHPHTQSV